MKHSLWVGCLSACLFAARFGHATDGWVQIPGAATQIAVGANDIPFVLDTNGYVQYLTPATLSCSQNLCVAQDRRWQWMNITASVIGADPYGYLWEVGSDGQMFSMLPSSTAFNATMWYRGSLSTGTATSLAPGRLQSMWPSGSFAAWNYPFGVAAGTQIFAVTGGEGNQTTSAIRLQYTTTYATDSGLSLFRFDGGLTFVGSELNETGDYHSFQLLDTGEMQVTQFMVTGSADQVPWVMVTSNGRRVAYAYSSGAFSYVGGPRESGHNFNVDCMTDHYIAANYGSYGAVYKWTGTAFGTGGTWSKLVNSDNIPSGGYVAQLAYASALPGTRIGTIGPSHLYMIDSYNNICQWGDVTGRGGVVK